MRPTVIRLIAGGALGAAFSVSLTLPGSVVFPDEQPIRRLASPEAPTATVLHAARVRRPRKARAQPRVVVRRVYLPRAGTVPATSVRPTPSRSTTARRSVGRAPARAERPVTPLAARQKEADEAKDEDERGDADEPKNADEPGRAERPRKWDEPKSAEPKKADKPRKSARPKKAKKPNDRGSGKKDKPDNTRKDDRDDQADDRRGHDKDKHGGGRSDDSARG